MLGLYIGNYCDSLGISARVRPEQRTDFVMQARIVLKLSEEADFSERIVNGFRRAIHEALQYVGRTAPNPPVGCAILDEQGNILTVAAHHQAGALHAEALALQQCKALGVWDKICDVIVTLEPCNHTGRTPPCSEALLKTPAKRIWIGVKDPNPYVAGAGHVRLREGGKEVILLDEQSSEIAQYWHQQCVDLLAPFTKFMLEQKSWLTVKQAMNMAGSMVPPKGQKTFTSQKSLTLAHQLRRGTEAIITGVNTIKMDIPSFTVRHVPDHPDVTRLLVICSQAKEKLEDALSEHYIEQAKANGFSLLLCNDLERLPELLYAHKVMWAMVEAGPVLLQEFRQRQLWDEWLTIRQQVQGEDNVNIISKHRASPTRQLLSDAHFHVEKEDLCSLVS
ncbi:bifunctional diaminohydroxyphosphoribosylaminopyrimidine deaminase/5-amino-6-(5-phosphoribosylamino)uracil reductase RibD [Commensalibacter communis]|uniref:bifunctional diaminohydroxyphosphoribosylaminopyrimidine deaminase/5-amino-6-(5-phosphoribosylamino)uracil reductase RibD n=1 Tax=Commensalibacter communis TaxID=2972786 RepID=UPI00232B137C|nr:bifunctional diaminohydroxyphosphoribosylaminopyrimidine deaminase/5-amino-6-(5-phosphoribosylamino)uracil reductase RibD [Commensalibacter communis]